MLLDQQRTKRMVKIVSIISAVAFVGVLPVALGLIIFRGDSNNPQTQLVKDAEARVKANPDDVTALVALASQYRANNRTKDATDTLQKAVTLGAKTSSDLTALVGGLAGQPAEQLKVLQRYTKANPKDADGWFTYGTTAEGAGQQLTARLAYQKAAALAPKGSQVAQNAQTALTRLRNAPITPPQPVPTTPATPVTP